MLHSAFAGLMVGAFGALINADGMMCFSILLMVVGILFLGFYTGPAAASAGWKSSYSPQQISETIVNLDSKARWRGKSSAEIQLGLIILVFALSASVVPLLVFIVHR